MLKAKRQSGGKARFDVELGGLPMTLARVSSTVWVFGFDAKKDMEAVDVGGHGLGGKQFPPGLAEMIGQRMPPEAAAWIATNDEHWDDKPGVKLLVKDVLKKPEWLPTLAQGRAAMAALSFGDEPRVWLCVKTADEATGQRLRDYFKSKANDKSRHGGGGEFAQFDMPIDPANTYATLQQFLSEGKK